MAHVILIRLVVGLDSDEESAFDAADRLLDEGTIQDAISEYCDDVRGAPVEFDSATVTCTEE